MAALIPSTIASAFSMPVWSPTSKRTPATASVPSAGASGYSTPPSMRCGCVSSGRLRGKISSNDCYSDLNASSNGIMAWSWWPTRWSTCEDSAVSKTRNQLSQKWERGLGKGIFSFCFLFLLRSFFYGCSSGTVLWVFLWPRVRVFLQGTPL